MFTKKLERYEVKTLAEHWFPMINGEFEHSKMLSTFLSDCDSKQRRAVKNLSIRDQRYRI